MSYLPRGDNAIIDWGQQFLIVISDPLNYDRWGIRKPSEEMNELYENSKGEPLENECRCTRITGVLLADHCTQSKARTDKMNCRGE